MSRVLQRWQVATTRPIAYEIIKVSELFAPDNDALLAVGPQGGGRRFVVVDANVARHYGAAIEGYFAARALHTRLAVFPGGEAHKTLADYRALARELDSFPVRRRDEPIIAIGGGVLTDVVGFLAASYRRGIPHIKVPTTLMGYIDAALGIKVAVNFNGHKNRLGSFEPPLAVFLDRTFLRTLTRRQLLNGVCEIIKLAVIRDALLFESLEESGAACVACGFQSAAADAILDRAIDGLLAELAPNLHEQELARPSDFGHTFSYGLEARHPNRLLHGEAVLLDILVSAAIAGRRGLLAPAEVARLLALPLKLGMRPALGLLDPPSMWRALLDRIEHRNGAQRVPLPAGLGNCRFVNDIRPAELEAAVAALHHAFATEPSHAAVLER